jgi:hypothetical protein
MTYIATEKEAHNWEIDEKIRITKREISKLLNELHSNPSRIRIPFPHSQKSIKLHIANNPNDDSIDGTPYLLEILEGGKYIKIDPMVVYGRMNCSELQRSVSFSELTHLYASPALLLDWKIPFEQSARKIEIERRRALGKQIAALRTQIKDLNESRHK